MTPQVSEIPVAILAGGLGTRMWPVTRHVPKAMLPVAGKPFLEHQIELLKTQGVRQIVICAGLMGEQIERCFGRGESWDVDLYYSYDGLQQLGTAGALKKALPLLGKRFFVLYGDSYLPTDLQPILDAALRSAAPGLMTVFRNSNRWVPSNVDFLDGTIRRYDKENPRNFHYVDYGLSLLTPEALRDVPHGVTYDLGMVFRNLIHARSLAGYEAAERFFEIGSPQGLQELEVILNTMVGVHHAA